MFHIRLNLMYLLIAVTLQIPAVISGVIYYHYGSILFVFVAITEIVTGIKNHDQDYKDEFENMAT